MKRVVWLFGWFFYYVIFLWELYYVVGYGVVWYYCVVCYYVVVWCVVDGGYVVGYGVYVFGGIYVGDYCVVGCCFGFWIVGWYGECCVGD